MEADCLLEAPECTPAPDRCAESVSYTHLNAREKAEILCEASNVALGDLLAIDYNWGELNVVSRTEYMLDEKCLAMPMGAMADMDIEPDDIDVSDTATFVWEIR